ncbi:MAG: IPT/TIG domain-containing protein [Akkermansiaceae bacterium]|nr:IPT/TIG domain-containing protein [Akkermansiaceae bacterium]
MANVYNTATTSPISETYPATALSIRDSLLLAAQRSEIIAAAPSISAHVNSILSILPNLSTLSLTSGATEGGTLMNIGGTSFAGVTAVTFGGTEAMIVSFTDTVITMITPAHSAGVVDVVVTTPAGRSADRATFTYVASLSALESWRQAQFGPSATNTGNAADAADPYRTGVPNLLVYAFFGPAQDLATAQVEQLPQATLSGDSLGYQFTEPSGVSGLTYGAEWSATLGND